MSKSVFYCLHSPFNKPIRLVVVWTAGRMREIILCCEISKTSCTKKWSIIAIEKVWNTMSLKYIFESCDYTAGQCNFIKSPCAAISFSTAFSLLLKSNGTLLTGSTAGGVYICVSYNKKQNDNLVVPLLNTSVYVSRIEFKEINGTI